MKKLLSQMAMTTPTTTDIALLVLRVWTGLMMAIVHGFPKWGKLDKMTEMLDGRGFPLPEVMAVLAASAETAGGLLLVIGLLTRPAAAGIVITMVIAAVVIHADDPFSKQEFALGYAAAALAVLIAGPGRFSLDRRLFGAKA